LDFRVAKRRHLGGAPFILYSPTERPMRERNYLKEPVAILWIVVGLVLSVAAMIGIERLVPRY